LYQVLIILFLFSSANFRAFAEEASIEADHISHNQIEKTIRAIGNATVTYQNRCLTANEIEYNLKTHRIKAIDNIHLTNEQNETITADSINIDDKLITGHITNLHAYFGKNHILYAKEAIKNNEVYELNKTFYTTCYFCENTSPEWKLYAEKATYNNNQKRMIYKNGKLYFKKLPILYFPYLFHSTNKDEKRAGFLFPKYKSSNKGAITIPFYIPIGTNKEVIYKPTISRAENVLNNLQYNHLTSLGQYSINLSMIKSKKKSSSNGKFEHFLDMHGKFNISPHIISGFDVEDTSDIGFREKYFFSEKYDYLTKNLYTNYFNSHDYITFDLVSFQNLKGVPDQLEAPRALPLIELHKEYNLSSYGNHLIDVNYLKTTRKEGFERDRLILGWKVFKTVTSDSGNIIDYSYQLRSDFYKTSFEDNSQKTVNRFLSQAAIKWRYPLIKYHQKGNILLEPITKLTIDSGKNKNHRINIEDGRNYELSHYNLFADSRYDGLDKIDHFSQFTYGLHTSVKGKINEFDLMLGQIFYLKHVPIVKENLKITKASDYLVKTNYTWSKLLKLGYKAKFDHKSFQNMSTESSLLLHLNNWKLYSSFSSFKDKYLDRMKYYKIGSTKSFNNNISLTAESAFTASSKLKNDSGIKIIYYKIISRYISECSNIKFELKREYPKNLLRDKKPHTKFSVEFKLKGLD
jgi:LPS-assembly protein